MPEVETAALPAGPAACGVGGGGASGDARLSAPTEQDRVNLLSLVLRRFQIKSMKQWVLFVCHMQATHLWCTTDKSKKKDREVTLTAGARDMARPQVLSWKGRILLRAVHTRFCGTVAECEEDPAGVLRFDPQPSRALKRVESQGIKKGSGALWTQCPLNGARSAQNLKHLRNQGTWSSSANLSART